MTTAKRISPHFSEEEAAAVEQAAHQLALRPADFVRAEAVKAARVLLAEGK